MLVTLVPIVTLVRPRQYSKAYSPMVMTLLGIVMLRQTGAGIERLDPDTDDVGADRDVGQAGAVVERPVPEAGHAVGDRDAGQAGAGERLVPDAGDVGAIVTLVRLVQ